MHRFRQPLMLSALLVAVSTSQTIAAPAMTLRPGVGHPKINVTVSGSGFTAGEAVDVYFDTTDEFIAFTDSTGRLPVRTFTVPKDALPGAHWITAIGRNTGDGLQNVFTVRTDWPQHGFEPHDRGRNPYENVLDASNVGRLDLAWSYATGGAIYGSPVSAEGLVFVGSADGNLYALNTAGAVRWIKPTAGAIESTPAVAKGNVYVGSDDGNIYAFNALTGAPLWTAATGGAVTSSPVIIGNTLYVGSADGALHALNATTGVAIWTRSTSGAIQYSSPAVADGVVYIGSDDHSLYALSAATGAVLWSYAAGGPIASSPAVADGHVYFSSTDAYLYALHAKGAGFDWKYQTGGSGDVTPSIVNGTVFAGSIALDSATGANKWADSFGGLRRNSLSIANGVGYVAVSGKRAIYALDLNSGATLWSASTEGYSYGTPAIVNGNLYIGSDDGRLYAFALDAGFNAKYNTNRPAPSYASLHPDFRLKPAK
jgi:outer membrane protein assembly factor BamB